jgi:retinol-binding protein 3
MRASSKLWAVLLIVGVVRASAQAHTAPPARLASATSLSASDIREVVDTVASQIEEIYVDADTAKLIATRLRAKLQSGAYASAPDGNRLAELLTQDLRSVNGDLHLGVRFTPPSPGPAPKNIGPPAFLGRAQHYALGKIDVLPGNIGYLELTGFAIDAAAESTVVAALEYLQTTDAIILDLRRNRGGSGELSNFFISHFTGADTTASLRISSRDPHMNYTRYTMAHVPGPRRPDVPLYILTSRGTASAAEDFTFVLQNLKRATIVGDRTAGAGHNVAMVPSGHGFATSISITRVADPKTGKEWERVGVQPDVRVDPAIALDTAQILALRTLEAKAPVDDRAHLAFLRDVRAAKMHPHSVAGATLEEFAGEYDGDRRVRAANGRLLYEPALGALADTLVSLSDSTFAASTQARLTFVRNAEGVVELHIRSPEGIDAVVRRRSASPLRREASRLN